MKVCSRLQSLSRIMKGMSDDDTLPVIKVIKDIMGFPHGGWANMKAKKFGAFKDSNGKLVMRKCDIRTWAVSEISKPERTTYKKNFSKKKKDADISELEKLCKEYKSSSDDWEARYKGSSKKINELQDKISILENDIKNNKLDSNGQRAHVFRVMLGCAFSDINEANKICDMKVSLHLSNIMKSLDCIYSLFPEFTNTEK